jgi:hypothetical protein
MQRIITISIFVCAGLASSGLHVEYNKDLYDTYEDLIEAASINGKYINLQHIIKVPEDESVYGPLYDWGYWMCDTYKGSNHLQPGFWVYISPNWYIWERLAAEDDIDQEASAYGKYMSLLHVLKVPQDIKTYGSFYDWGFSEEYSYAGYNDLTPGYWVYYSPNWYIWAETKENTGCT